MAIAYALHTTPIYDNLGRLTDIKAGTVQHLKYTWDPVKQLISQRQDILKGLSESFTYDHLKRLESYQVSGLPLYTMAYDPNGNITQKTDIGLYSYNATTPHAVEEVQNTDVAIPEIPQTISYNHLNKISTITEGIHSLDVSYGLDGLRRVTELKENGVLKKKKIFLGLYEKIEENGSVRELHYINGPMGLAAIHEIESGTGTTYWMHTDHLGSYHVVTNSTGQKVEEYNFDPWGRRRNPDTWDYANLPTNYRYDRGFTGHEHLDEFGLINMNGRVYDQKLARFLSPDPIIQAPGYTQDYNGYSYAFNNPLHYTDPSGYTEDEGVQNQNDESTKTLLDAIEKIGNSDYGGYWSPSGGVRLFRSDDHAMHYISNRFTNVQWQSARYKSGMAMYHYSLLNPSSELRHITKGENGSLNLTSKYLHFYSHSILEGLDDSYWDEMEDVSQRLKEISERAPKSLYSTEQNLGNPGSRSVRHKSKLSTYNSLAGFAGSGGTALEKMRIKYTYRYYVSSRSGTDTGIRIASRLKINLSNAGQFGKLVGGYTLFLGTAIDGVGVYNHYNNPDAALTVHPMKGGLNLGVATFAFFGGMGAATCGVFYFAIDSTIGIENGVKSFVEIERGYNKTGTSFNQVRWATY